MCQTGESKVTYLADAVFVDKDIELQKKVRYLIAIEAESYRL